ncbi:hypothetical protein, partial [Microcystis aeruginosa]|uniref:hypothetical protein n=1 Tax=Microcystis aeruginosa TaxID=1126 RepID=UPI001C101B9E
LIICITISEEPKYFTQFILGKQEGYGTTTESLPGFLPTFRTLVVEIKSCSSPCIVRLLAITKNYEVSHSSQRSPA